MPIAIPEEQLHELTIEWPSSKPQTVVLTGEFDHWSHSLHLQRTPAGTFAGTIRVPYGQPTRYKFIVDGKWMVREGAPTEVSPEGYVNNVYWAPAEGVRKKGQGEEKGKEEGEEKKSKVMVDKAVNGNVEDVKQDPPSVQEAIATSVTVSALPPVQVAPNVPIPILPIIDQALNGPDVPKSSNDASESYGDQETSGAADPDRHTHIVPALVGSPSSPPNAGKDSDNGTKEVNTDTQNGSSVLPPAASSVPAVTDNSEGSEHRPKSTPTTTTTEDPELQAHSQTPTATQSPVPPQVTEPPAAAATTPIPQQKSTTPSTTPLSSPSKSHHHHRSPSKTSSLFGTWKKGGRRISSSLLHHGGAENGSLERQGSKATTSSSSNSSSSNKNGDGAVGGRKRRSSIFERLKHRMSDLLHDRHGKEKSGDSI